MCDVQPSIGACRVHHTSVNGRQYVDESPQPPGCYRLDLDCVGFMNANDIGIVYLVTLTEDYVGICIRIA